LSQVTPDEKTFLEDGTKLPTYYPDVKNRTELVMIDQDPERDARAAKEAGKDKKKGMGADSVLSMARMFAAGHVPGSSLSDLQEDTLLAKKQVSDSSRFFSWFLSCKGSYIICVSLLQAYYAAFLGGSTQNKTGAKLASRSQANLMARAGRAKGMVRAGDS